MVSESPKLVSNKKFFITVGYKGESYSKRTVIVLAANSEEAQLKAKFWYSTQIEAEDRTPYIKDIDNYTGLFVIE